MASENRLARTVGRFSRFPAGLRRALITWAFGGAVRFVRTAGIRFEELTAERAILTLRNRRKVRNHIGTVHGAAAALLGETATGAVFGMNVPDDKVPLLKSMRVEYTRRSEGMLRAEASLSGEMRARLGREEKGDLAVPVRITDETGEPTLQAEYIWAWRPRKR